MADGQMCKVLVITRCFPKFILKVDPTVTTHKDRFDRPNKISDLCQGLDWWMTGDLIHVSEYYM